MVQLSECLGNTNDKTYYSELLAKAKSAYENLLWNGSYYNFDESNHEAKSIMADQLCGHWYLCCCGIKNYPVRLLWRIYSVTVSYLRQCTRSRLSELSV